MKLTLPPAGKLAILSTFSALILLITWTIAVLYSSKHYISTSDVPKYRFDEQSDMMSRLPRLSADKKTLVVTTEEGLPNAFEFLRLNMYLPIQKIVLIKPGVNDSVRVYPISRSDIVGLGRDKLALALPEIGLTVLFLIFMLGACAFVCTCMSSQRCCSEEDGWLGGEDSCLDSIIELSGDEDAEDDKLLLGRAEKKRKEIETV